jgi:hypothetical protein
VSGAGRDGSYKWTVLVNTTIGTLMATALSSLSPARQAVITGHGFFPGLISGPFHHRPGLSPRAASCAAHPPGGVMIRQSRGSGGAVLWA